jgi:hypothetical protein
MAISVNAQDFSAIEFEPKVGAIGSRVVVKGQIAKGSQIRFGNRNVPVTVEGSGRVSFMVPEASVTAFIEVTSSGRLVGRSAVPFVVSGSSIVGPMKLIGLREAIDVFGYSEQTPVGGGKPEQMVRPVLKFDDEAILTIGEPDSMRRLAPAVDMGDLASAARGPLGTAGFLITARAPKKKLKPAPAETVPVD